MPDDFILGCVKRQSGKNEVRGDLELLRNRRRRLAAQRGSPLDPELTGVCELCLP